MLLEIILFIVVFFCLANLFQINFFGSQIGSTNFRKTVKDKSLSKMLEDVDLMVGEFIIFETDKPFMMMPAMFGSPRVIISNNLYETFNKEEIKYVLMHEAAHYLFKHNIKDAFFQMGPLLIGALMILNFQLNILGSSLLGVISAILFVQLARLLEREADIFASKNSNPKAMISATEKFRNSYPENSTLGYLKNLLFSWNIMFDERILIAKRAL